MDEILSKKAIKNMPDDALINEFKRMYQIVHNTNSHNVKDATYAKLLSKEIEKRGHSIIEETEVIVIKKGKNEIKKRYA